MRQRALPIYEEYWIFSKDANPTALAIFHTHYSYRPYVDGRKPQHFVGPGGKMVLLTPNADALFVWRKFISGDGQQGINCAVFHNDSPIVASTLIREASHLAWQRWPGERLYTYVSAKKLTVRRVRNAWRDKEKTEPSSLEYCPWPPGRCFIEAGWRYCGITKWNKHVILEMKSDW